MTMDRGVKRPIAASSNPTPASKKTSKKIKIKVAVRDNKDEKIVYRPFNIEVPVKPGPTPTTVTFPSLNDVAKKARNALEEEWDENPSCETFEIFGTIEPSRLTKRGKVYRKVEATMREFNSETDDGEFLSSHAISSQEECYGRPKHLESNDPLCYVTYTGARSYIDYFRNSMLPKVEYANKMPVWPTKVQWDQFRMKPKEVEEWTGFDGAASDYLANVKLDYDLRYYQYDRVPGHIENESGFDSFVTQFFFGPIHEMNKHSGSKFQIRPQKKPEEKAKEKIDYMVVTDKGGQFPFELKTKETMKASKAFSLAIKHLSKEKLPDKCWCVAQIYKYMVKSGLKYIMLSNYEETLFLRARKTRDKHVRLEISRPILRTAKEPYFHQALAYFSSLVGKGDGMFPYEDCEPYSSP